MKKLNKFFAVLVALAMMATLCVSMAFATDEQAGKGVTPTGNQLSDKAIIGKYFQVADGVTVPDATFTFTFTAKPSDTNEGGPAIAAQTMKAKEMTETEKDGDGNSVAGIIEIAKLVKGADEKLIFTAPGEYIYEVEESNDKQNGGSTTEGVKTTTETYTNDTSKKVVRIYVKYNDAGELVIDTITITDGTGKKATTTTNPITDKNYTPSSDGSGNTFNNNYEKKDTIKETDLTKDNALLEVSKTVSAKTGYVDANQEFPFTIKLTKPTNDTSNATSVTAYIIKGDNKKATTINYSSTDFVLKDGEALCFGELPYGTTYEVKENLTKEVDGKEVVVNHANFSATAAWSDGSVGAPGKGVDIEIKTGLVDDKARDTVDVINTLDNKDVEPEGILISNLPYIALALVAVGGLVAYVVVRRKADDEA